MLYLSSAAIAGLDLSLDALREAIAAAYAAAARREALAPAKLAMEPGPHRLVQAMMAALPGRRRAAVKWLSVVPAEAAEGATVKAVIILTDTENGAMLATMDAAWITASRTAAMSAIAARRLAGPQSRHIAFIGCGVQARSHLAALARVFPHLVTVSAYGRRRETAKRFAAEAAARGFAAAAAASPREAVEGADLIVTSVPASPGLAPLVDPAWLAPQAFVSAVDLGRSLMPHGLARFGMIATDERAQSERLGKVGKLVTAGPFAADLADLVSDGAPAAAGPSLFVFAGHALADLAAAEAVYTAAIAAGIGMALPD